MNHSSRIAVLCELGAIACAVLYFTDAVSRLAGPSGVGVLLLLLAVLALGSLVFAIVGVVARRESKRLARFALVFAILGTIAIIVMFFWAVLQSMANGLGG